MVDAVYQVEARILDWLAASQPAMEALLQALVDIDSGSGDTAGIEAVASLLEAFLAKNRVRVARLSTGTGSDLLSAAVAEDAEGAPALLMGHMDTVFPKGSAARRPFHASAERVYGPGVADMKAGLVMHAFVLAAFARFGGGHHPVKALLTTDEEIASPASRRFIMQAALGARMALNGEPGRSTGNVVIERKGGIFTRLRVHGRATHSGIDFPGGASAITELAHKIVALEALTDITAGLTVNVGLISGGQSINTVAPNAEASTDIRYVNSEQRTPLLARLEEIVDDAAIPGTRTELEIIGEFHPMVPTAEALSLLETYQDAAKTLGFSVGGEATGGCSDAGFAASLGTPTLCGLGPVGGHAHTDAEYVERASLTPRAQAVALTILRHQPLQAKAMPVAPHAQQSSRPDQW